jgi:transmembrane sensor
MADDPSFFQASGSPVDVVAARWLARRDRGFTAQEQDEFLQWLREDPRHTAAAARLEKAWGALDALAAEWRPEHSVRPNPDLLAGPAAARAPRREWIWFAVISPKVLLAAAAVMLGVFWFRVGPPPVALPPRPAVVREVPFEAALAHPGLVRHESQRMTLPDGSIVELNAGTRIEVAFVPEERRVRLMTGEAHFTVAKNPSRPFVVATSAVAVRAVGTAFDVRLGDEGVAVLVTEGKVRLDRPTEPGAAPVGAPVPDSPLLVAGQRAVIATPDRSVAPGVTPATSADLERVHAWRGVRLEFADMPLAEIAAEFNHHNARQLVPGDAVTGALRVGGNFRADNVDAFVRLLESSFGVEVSVRDDGVTVLRRR